MASLRSILSKSPDNPSFNPFLTDSIAFNELFKASRCLEFVIIILLWDDSFRFLDINSFNPDTKSQSRAEIL